MVRPADNKSIMSYEIGQHIDLSYINRKHPAAQKKSSFQAEAKKLWEVGSKVIFVRLFPAVETIVVAPA